MLRERQHERYLSKDYKQHEYAVNYFSFMGAVFFNNGDNIIKNKKTTRRIMDNMNMQKIILVLCGLFFSTVAITSLRNLENELYRVRFALLRNAIVSGNTDLFQCFYDKKLSCSDDEIYYALQYVSGQYKLDYEMNHRKFESILTLMQINQPDLYALMSLRLACGDYEYYTHYLSK